MNYIQEINAFYEDVEAAGLTAKEINLFNALLRINNKANWKKVFTVRPSYLEKLTGQSSSTNTRARKALAEKGYITFEQGTGSRMSRFQIIPAAERKRPEAPAEIEEETETIPDPGEPEKKPEPSEPSEPPEAPEKVESEVQEETDEVNPHTFYQNNFGTLSPFLIDNITQWASDMSDELVIAAMKTALRNNKKSFGYAEGVLKDWQSKNITTIEDARAEQKRFQSQRKYNNVTPIRAPSTDNDDQYDYGF